MLLGTENTDFQPASESLIHEMMGDATRRGRHMVLETTEAADAFIQFAFLDETSGCLEYRDEATKTLYHCARPVTALEAATAEEYRADLEAAGFEFAVKGTILSVDAIPSRVKADTAVKLRSEIQQNPRFFFFRGNHRRNLGLVRTDLTGFIA